MCKELQQKNSNGSSPMAQTSFANKMCKLKHNDYNITTKYFKSCPVVSKNSFKIIFLFTYTKLFLN